MEQCKTLQEYSRFVARVRERAEQASGPLTEKELNALFRECIEDGILVDFLEKYGTEVISMLYMEMTEEEARDLAREDGYEVGFEEGLEKGRRQILSKIVGTLKESGMSLDEIAKTIGLTTEEIEKI